MQELLGTYPSSEGIVRFYILVAFVFTAFHVQVISAKIRSPVSNLYLPGPHKDMAGQKSH